MRFFLQLCSSWQEFTWHSVSRGSSATAEPLVHYVYQLSLKLCFWATVFKMVRHNLSEWCLSDLSVTLVYCGQTAPSIKMKLGTELGLGPSHIVLDGNPAHPKKGHSPRPILCPCLLWPNAWMHQDATWYTGRPRPRPHCARSGTSSPSKKGHSSPIIGQRLLQPNGWMHLDATWYGGRPLPRWRWGPSSPPPKKGAQIPIFGPCLLWPKSWMDQDATQYAGRPRPRPHC